MLKSFKKNLERRLESLQKTATLLGSCETKTRDFIVHTIGQDSLRFLKGIHHLPSRELLIETSHKAFAMELTVRKEALLEYIREKGEQVVSIRIQ